MRSVTDRLFGLAAPVADNGSKPAGWSHAFFAALALSLVVGHPAYSAPADVLFTEDFNREVALIGRDRQAQSALRVKHGHALPGWTKQGDDLPVHWVEQYPGNWALMLVARRMEQNVFTQNDGMAVNDKGHVYTVSFDAGPAVYAHLSQATAADDQIAVELLRPDGTVLAKHVVTPGEWRGKAAPANHAFTYEGDGTGPLRFRISPVYTSGFRFFGAIDHLEVFSSEDAAKTAVAARRAVERAARERAAEAMAVIEQGYLPLIVRNPATPPTRTLPADAADAVLRRDWLFQAESLGSERR